MNGVLMIQDFFCKYYDYRPFNNKLLNKILGNSSKLLLTLANFILPFYFRVFPGTKYYKKHYDSLPKTDAIICFTSFPARIGNVWLVIETLLRQTVLPKKIVLYLSKIQFQDQNTLPSELTKYIDLGVLSVRFVDDDIRSHKKYWYAVSEFPTSPIITVDDDIIYLSNFIEGLEHASQLDEHSIPCYYWTYVGKDETGDVLPYTQWPHRRKQNEWSEKSSDVFFGSGGGTFFPVGSLAGADESFEVLRKVCPMADDIWLNAVVRENAYFPIGLPYLYSVPEWKCKGNVTLNSENNGNSKNDKQLFAVIEYFKEKFGNNPFCLIR